MKRAYIFKHVPFEGPGRIAKLLAARGHAVEICELYRSGSVPQPADDELLIVMGGPMGVEDRDRPEYPFLHAELELLERRVRVDAPTLGVCLGAQLMAAAAGARVAPMRAPDGEALFEIGWGAMDFLHAGAGDRVLHGLPSNAHVLHWHGDMFEIPQGARRLAATKICPNQGFQLGRKQFGLQFHCEVDGPDISGFVAADPNFVRRAGVSVEGFEEESRRRLPEFALLGDRLLDNVLDLMEG